MLISDQNYLNLKKEERDKKIYRYISFERLAEIFETSKLTLVKPSKWDDPFENIILKYYETKAAKDKFDNKYRDCVYGQCWTYSSGSDALWRIYSHNKDGLWIRSTVEKLFEELYLEDKIRNATCFIGKVTYVRQSELLPKLKSFSNTFSNKPINKRIADSLLWKRKSFEHEKEVRLIYIDIAPNKKDIISFHSDPHMYIDKIMFDPRIDDVLFNKNKDIVKNEFGFKGRVVKSALYKLPDYIK